MSTVNFQFETVFDMEREGYMWSNGWALSSKMCHKKKPFGELWGICCDKVHNIDGLVQQRRDYIASALESRLSCTNPSIFWYARHLQYA